LQIALTQTGANLSGTFAVLPAGPNNQGSFGSLSGSVSGGAVTLTATDEYGGSCTTALSANATGALLAGSFTDQSPCNGSGIFSAVLQTASLPSLSGTYSGSIDDTENGPGTLTLTITQPGTVFSGTATVSFTNYPTRGGTSALVGFVTNATTAEFGVINSGSSPSCNPVGTFTIGSSTLTGTYVNSGDPNGGCTATGSLSLRP
jgi:hypothetical protein